VGGAIKLFQDRKNNPPAPRDPRLPPKPAGQTVGSFNKGLRVLTDAIGAKLQGEQQQQQQQQLQQALGCTGHCLHSSR
jgi:oxygen-dependent protoporphyrinogen oxidase